MLSTENKDSKAKQNEKRRAIKIEITIYHSSGYSNYKYFFSEFCHVIMIMIIRTESKTYN